MKQGKLDCLRWSAERFVGGDTAVLRGEEAAIVYGCCRILKYEETRVCLARRNGRISVWGEGLLCTSFSAGTVTVEGRILGMRCCHTDCDGCEEESR